MSRGPFFEPTGEGLDRFGVLLIATFVAVSLASLIDLRAPQESVSHFVALTATSALSAGTLLLATRAAGVARRLRRPVALVVVAGLAGSVLAFALDSTSTSTTELSPPPLVTVLLAVLSPVLVCRRLVQHRVVTIRTVLGAVAAYLLIALALFYVLLTMEWLLDDPLFGTVEPTTSFMYFALTTITTVGYGDLTPVDEWARYAAVATAMIGQVFLVVFVAMIVSRFRWGDERPFALADDTDQPRSAQE